MRECVFEQLALDLNCSPADFDKEGMIFCVAKDNEGRRPFPRGEIHFEMLTAGKSVIVCASEKNIPYVKTQLQGKTCDEAFGMPFVHGTGMYYLPDLKNIKPFLPPENYEYKLYEKDEIPVLYELDGFSNALASGQTRILRPDVIAITASRAGKIIGMAGASADSAKMWQIGIDVFPEHRGNGLAAYLVNKLTLEIIERGFIPYYGTSVSNIASQSVAHRAGYIISWICSWKGRFDGEITEATC